MKIVLKLEVAAMLVLSYLAFSYLNLPAWWFWVFLFAPDVSMLGYLINPKVGAVSYNMAHHKAIAIVILVIGFLLPSVNPQFVGIITFGHSSMDRVLGYGLKYPDSFQHTHLGFIGGKKPLS